MKPLKGSEDTSDRQQGSQSPVESASIPSLQDVRRKQHLTQLDLAIRSGVGDSTIRTIERGKAHPSERTKQWIARALGITPGEIDWTKPSTQTTGVD